MKQFKRMDDELPTAMTKQVPGAEPVGVGFLSGADPERLAAWRANILPVKGFNAPPTVGTINGTMVQGIGRPDGVDKLGQKRGWATVIDASDQTSARVDEQTIGGEKEGPIDVVRRTIREGDEHIAQSMETSTSQTIKRPASRAVEQLYGYGCYES